MAEAMSQPLPDIPPVTIAPLAPVSEEDTAIDSSPITSPEPQYARPQDVGPLYTEINIPLPPLPGTPTSTTPGSPMSATSPTSKSRHRRFSSHSFSPFHKRRSSSPSVDLPEPELKKPEPRIELSMRAVSRGRKKRSSTVEAAIVPAVMVLSAELFTPGEGERGKNMNLKDRLEVVK